MILNLDLFWFSYVIFVEYFSYEKFILYFILKLFLYTAVLLADSCKLGNQSL
jgi:hypothetical protein